MEFTFTTEQKKKSQHLLLTFLLNYFNSTVAPASSNCALIFSASSLSIPSLTFPPLSAISLASFNPKPVISLTNLITKSLLSN